MDITFNATLKLYKEDKLHISWHNRNMRILVLVSLFSILLDVGIGRLDLSNLVHTATYAVNGLRRYEKQAGCDRRFNWGDGDGVCDSLW